MSKSLGNALDPKALVDEFSLDALRFFLMREVPFGGDSNFSRRSMITRMNVELANDLGNLAQRSLSQIAKNLGGVLPERGVLTEDDQSILALAQILPSIMAEQIERKAITEALEEAWKLVRAANSYIDRQAPWALNKTNMDRMAAGLRVLVDRTRVV